MERPTNSYLATIDENGSPSIRSVFNLRCKEKYPIPAKVIEDYDDNPYTVYISTNTSSVKIKQISKDNKIAMYFSIPEEVKGVMLQGEVEVLDDMKFKETIWDDKWKMYYPLGYDDPDFTILKFTPIKLRGWYRGHLEHEFKV